MKSIFEIQINPTFFLKEIRKFASIPKKFFSIIPQPDVWLKWDINDGYLSA